MRLSARSRCDFLPALPSSFFPILCKTGTDWEYVLNTFVFGMSVGYHFIESSTGSCNGNFVGIGADCCTNSSVQVDSSDPWGILITNGEFTSFSFGADTPQDHTQVVVSASNAGAVSFVNSAFWGPSHKIASSSGKASSSLSFDSCVFNEWDSKGTGQPAILSNGGDLQVRGCTFQRSHPGGQVVLGAGSGKAIITENLITGKLLVTNNGAKLAVIENNAPDS